MKQGNQVDQLHENEYKDRLGAVSDIDFAVRQFHLANDPLYIIAGEYLYTCVNVHYSINKKPDY
jgi:hypothetical protein